MIIRLTPHPSAPDQAQVWAPYLAHYTVTSTGEQVPAPVINPAQLVQAEQTPSHAGIFNSNFAISDPLSATFGWDESGAVTIANGQAVLSEDSNVISTLSQLFTLPAGSTHLRFTLVDANLHTNGANRPSDAFEVAFLESSTLTSLAGVTAGLTQTDSLFNLQQDGTVRFSNRVSLSNGTLSGSTLDLTQPVIVDIDLTGITTGAGATTLVRSPRLRRPHEHRGARQRATHERASDRDTGRGERLVHGGRRRDPDPYSAWAAEQ